MKDIKEATSTKTSESESIPFLTLVFLGILTGLITYMGNTINHPALIELGAMLVLASAWSTHLRSWLIILCCFVLGNLISEPNVIFLGRIGIFASLLWLSDISRLRIPGGVLVLLAWSLIFLLGVYIWPTWLDLLFSGNLNPLVSLTIEPIFLLLLGVLASTPEGWRAVWFKQRLFSLSEAIAHAISLCCLLPLAAALYCFFDFTHLGLQEVKSLFIFNYEPLILLSVVTIGLLLSASAYISSLFLSSLYYGTRAGSDEMPITLLPAVSEVREALQSLRQRHAASQNTIDVFEEQIQRHEETQTKKDVRLARSLEELATITNIFSATPFAVAAFDRKGICISTSKEFCNICQCNPSDLIAAPIQSVRTHSSIMSILVETVTECINTQEDPSRPQFLLRYADTVFGKKFELVVIPCSDATRPMVKEAQTELGTSLAEMGVFAFIRSTPDTSLFERDIIQPSRLDVIGLYAVQLCNKFEKSIHQPVRSMLAFVHSLATKGSGLPVDLTILLKQLEVSLSKFSEGVQELDNAFSVRTAHKELICLPEFIRNTLSFYARMQSCSTGEINIGIEDGLHSAIAQEGAPAEHTAFIWAVRKDLSQFLSCLLALLDSFKANASSLVISIGKEKITEELVRVTSQKIKPGDYIRLKIWIPKQVGSIATVGGHLPSLDSTTYGHKQSDMTSLLLSMEAKRLGALLSVQSSPAKGALVTICFPTETQAGNEAEPLSIANYVTENAAEIDRAKLSEDEAEDHTQLKLHILILAKTETAGASFRSAAEELGHICSYEDLSDLLKNEDMGETDFSPGAGFEDQGDTAKDAIASEISIKLDSLIDEHDLLAVIAPSDNAIEAQSISQELLSAYKEKPMIIVGDQELKQTPDPAKCQVIYRPVSALQIKEAVSRLKL